MEVFDIFNSRPLWSGFEMTLLITLLLIEGVEGGGVATMLEACASNHVNFDALATAAVDDWWIRRFGLFGMQDGTFLLVERRLGVG